MHFMKKMIKFRFVILLNNNTQNFKMNYNHISF